MTEETNITDEIINVYVDGSYNKDNNLTGAGIVILYNERIYKKAFGVITEEEHSWNIDGECHAVLEALRICTGEVIIDDFKIEGKNITISYDYMGIEKWATREWKVKSKIARLYVKQFDDLVSKYKLNIKFNKIKAHTGDKYNEMADELAYSVTMSLKKD